jgi:hypothetical protein
MSLAENLLNTLPDNSAATRTGGGVEEGHIIIDENRHITIPDELKIIAVTNDKNVETVTFDCVRYWDGHDLSNFAIYLNYTLPNGTSGTYIPSDIVRYDDHYSFDWTIDRPITEKEGSLTIALTAVLTDTNGTLLQQWGSFPNSEMTIVKGLSVGEVPDTEEAQDVLSQIVTELNNKVAKTDIVQESGESTDKVMSQKAVSDALKNFVPGGGGSGSGGIYVGSSTPPEGANVWIDTDTEDFGSLEDWNFEMDDGSTVTKTIIVPQDKVLVGLRVKQPDGTWLDIPAIVVSQTGTGGGGVGYTKDKITANGNQWTRIRWEDGRYEAYCTVKPSTSVNTFSVTFPNTLTEPFVRYSIVKGTLSFATSCQTTESKFTMTYDKGTIEEVNIYVTGSIKEVG